MPYADKAQLRAQIRSLKCLFPAHEKAAEEAALWARLRARTDFQRARTMLLYCALPDEPDTRPLLREYVEAKVLFLPVVTGEGTMELRRYTGDESLRQGAYGILEPTGARLEDLSRIDLALIPGVAFTPGGQRLGRGGGYYDRLLANPAWQATALGVCFSFQRVSTLPCSAHDIPVNELL